MNTVAEIDRPEFVAADLLAGIRAGMAAHPRSRQTVIGPSGLGDPCSRRVLHRLNGDLEPPGAGVLDGWVATIGVGGHAQLGGYFEGNPRYAVEQRVHVGTVGGVTVSGNCDLYDRETHTVIDWKIVGPNRLLEYRRHGPGPQYIAQINLYAKGLIAAGMPVRTTMIMFLPRNSGLNQAFPYFDDYHPEIAEAALQRADGLATLLQLQGIAAAEANFPACDNWYCHYCRTDRPRTVPTTTAELLGQRKA